MYDNLSILGRIIISLIAVLICYVLALAFGGNPTRESIMHYAIGAFGYQFFDWSICTIREYFRNRAAKRKAKEQEDYEKDPENFKNF